MICGKLPFDVLYLGLILIGVHYIIALTNYERLIFLNIEKCLAWWIMTRFFAKEGLIFASHDIY